MKRIIIAIALLAFSAASAQIDRFSGYDWEDLIYSSDDFTEYRKFDSAFVYSEKAAERAKAEFGENSDQYAISLGRLGRAQFLSGAVAKSIETYEKQKEIYSNMPEKNNLGYMKACNNVGTALQYVGEYQKSQDLLGAAKSLKEKNLGSENISYSITLHNLGKLYQTTGKYAEAEEALAKSLELKKRLLGEKDVSYGKTLFNLGLLYQDLGDYARCRSYLEQSEKIFDEELGGKAPLTASVQTRLATLYLAMHENDLAEKYLEKSADFRDNYIDENHPDYPAQLYDLAMLEWSKKNYDEAKKLLKKAIPVIEERLGAASSIYSAALNSLGLINWLHKDYPEALKYLKKAEQIRKQTLGENHPGYATTIHNIAGVLADLDDLEAEDYYRRAFDLYLKQIDSYFPFLSESEKANFFSMIMERFDMFNCYAVAQKDKNPMLLADMFDYRLATKALLFKTTKNINDAVEQSGDSRLRTLYETRRQMRKELAYLYSLTKAEAEALGKNVDSLEREVNKIEKEISERFFIATNSSLLTKRHSWRDVQAFLKKDEAAVEILRFNIFNGGWTDNVYYVALIITKETQNYPEIVVFDDKNDFEGQYIKIYNNSIRFKVDDKESWEAFWKPIEEKIEGKTTVFLSPDGVYNQINVNTLRRPDGEYVLEDTKVFLVMSAADLLEKGGRKSSSKKTASLFGNPKYKLDSFDGGATGSGASAKGAAPTQRSDRSQRKYLSQSTLNEMKKLQIEELPGAQKEVSQISSALEKNGWDSQIFMREKASEETLKSAGDKRLLHIATHGFFLKDVDDYAQDKVFGVDIKKAAENPLLKSGLLFAGAENFIYERADLSDDDENGVLTSFEAMNLDLGGTELVALSACETGLGEIKNGEGVYGLKRAFQIAGADAIIMSLWKVSDEATQELMVAFYDNWLGGSDVYDSFLAAQKKLKKKYENPYFWGAFVLVCDKCYR